MAQRSTALTVLPEDLGSIPSTHSVAHNHLYLQSQGILLGLSGALWAHYCTDIQASKISTGTK